MQKYFLDKEFGCYKLLETDVTEVEGKIKIIK